MAPHRFIFSRPFALVFILYSSTYLAANGLDTASSTFAIEPPINSESEQKRRTEGQKPRDPAYTTSGTPKFLATSITNLSLCVYKDSQFAKYFGAPTSTRPVPPISLLLFGARDALTIFASFNLPSIIAPRLSLAPIGLRNIDQAWEKHVSRASAAQFLAPAAVQIFSTPLHLLGLDLYNRQDGTVSRINRFHKIWSDWGKSVSHRSRLRRRWSGQHKDSERMDAQVAIRTHLISKIKTPLSRKTALHLLGAPKMWDLHVMHYGRK